MRPHEENARRFAEMRAAKGKWKINTNNWAPNGHHSGFKPGTPPEKSLRSWGITREEYEELWKAQDGKCKICERTERECDRRFHIDHCRVTGDIRGLLCFNCNVGLGNFKDDPERLKKAMIYLTS